MAEFITGAIFGAARAVHATQGAVTPTLIRVAGIVALMGIAAAWVKSTVTASRTRRARRRTIRAGGHR